MKITCLFFTVTVLASLTSGTFYASAANQDRTFQQSSSQTSENAVGLRARDSEHGVRADRGKHQRDGNTSGEQRDQRHVSGKNHLHSPATITKNHPNQLPNNRVRPPSRSAMDLHPPGSDKSDGGAKGGFIRHDTVNGAAVPRPPSVIRPNMPLVNSVRHRGANPAVIGGSANSDGRNSGLINGTRVHRRP